MDCESRCRSKSHAFELNCAITKGTFGEAKSFIQRCHNYGKTCDAYGRTLLHVAASCGREELLSWLLSTGKCDVNQKDKESGWTALHRAIFYGHIGAAVALIRAGASLTIRDNEGLTPLDLAMKDSWLLPFVQLTKAGLHKHGNADVYTWGDNSNYTLGHRSEQSRGFPDVIEFFSKHETSIKEVTMTKYHSIFLSLDGRVFVCGHGQGGRLGLGHEEPMFQPMKVNGLPSKCLAVAAGRDHSLFLLEGGVVYGCGLNEYYQLGEHADSVSRKLLMPKPIFIKSLKGKPASEQVMGVCAGRYHSALYSANSLFTVGLNAGQLGHLKSDSHDACQRQPRAVSSIHQHGANCGIKQVCCSDAATAVLMATGEIYVLHEYQCRKVTRYAGCVQIAVCGGHLDHRLDPEVLREKGGSELLVCALSASGQVFMWRETWQSFARLDWNIGRQITVTDMALSLYDILVCTSEGEAFRAALNSVKRDRVVDEKWDHFTVAAVRGVASSGAAAETISKRAADARARRVVGIHRAVAVALDHKSTCFAVLQAQPVIENSFVEIPESSFVHDFESLLESADFDDGLADAHLLVGKEIVPAHRYILASRSEYFRCRVGAAGEVLPVSVPVPAGISLAALRHILKFIYGGELDIAAATAAFEPLSSHGSSKLSVHGGGDSDCGIPSLLQDVCDSGKVWNADKGPGKNGREDKGSSGSNGKASPAGSAPAELALCALKDAARLVKVKELLDRVSSVVSHKGGFMVTKTVTKRLPTYCRDGFTHLHDIVLESSDGQDLPCHKCILSARLEYFRTMLSAVWIEGSTDCAGDRARLALPVPADVLRAVIDYLYTDDLVCTDGLRSAGIVEYLCTVLVVADQWLIEHLKSICEARLVAQLTYKNVWSILQFALVYGARSLTESCQEFVCLNLAHILEALAHDSSLVVSGDDDNDELAAALRSVSAYYRQHLPCMSRRIITPYVHDNPSAAEMARAFADNVSSPAVVLGLPPGRNERLPSHPPAQGKVAKGTRRKERLFSSSSACSSDTDLGTSPVKSPSVVMTVSEGDAAKSACRNFPEGASGVSASSGFATPPAKGQSTPAALPGPKAMAAMKLTFTSQPLQAVPVRAAMLRDIIHAEEAAAASPSRNCQPNQGAAASRLLTTKATKVSQKEKKKQAAIGLLSAGSPSQADSSVQPAARSAHLDVTTSGNSQQQHCPWGTPNSIAAVSLRDVMVRESKSALLPSVATELAAGRASKVAGRTPLHLRSLSLSAGDASASAGSKAPSKPRKGEALAWNTAFVSGPTPRAADHDQPPSSLVPTLSPQPMPFKLIVDSELKQSETRLKLTKKPLALIQIEESAIAELYCHYQALASCAEERLTVERVRAVHDSSASCHIPHSWAAHASPQK